MPKNVKIQYWQDLGGFYFNIKFYDLNYYKDEDICRFINIDINIYKKQMEEYNCHYYAEISNQRQIRFSTMYKARKAKQWIESMYMAKLLIL